MFYPHSNRVLLCLRGGRELGSHRLIVLLTFRVGLKQYCTTGLNKLSMSSRFLPSVSVMKSQQVMEARRLRPLMRKEAPNPREL